MKKFDHHVNESLDFRDVTAWELQAACLYEHMRESRSLRDELNGRGKSDQDLQCPFYPNWMLARVSLRVRRLGRYTLQSPFLPNLTLPQLGVLFVALQKAGFPRPWKLLNDDSKTQLVSLLGGVTKRRAPADKETYPPVIIEEGSAEFDPSENCRRVGQLEPFELSLFSGATRSGRKPFLGFIFIDTGCNETEAVEAFRGEFRKRWGKTNWGGGTRWRDRLKQLAVMRIWKGESHQWKRLKLVAEVCGYRGCKREAAAYKKRCEEGRGDGPMSEAAKVEMSKARGATRTFFQSLFPGEEPLSY